MIEQYHKELSKRTPCIILEAGKIVIIGRSIPDNPGEFYGPVLAWVSNYKQHYTAKTEIRFGFEYINTASTKWIFIILKELSEMKDLSWNTSVIWFYEKGDEDMNELGSILSSLVGCPFVMTEVDEMNNSWFNQFAPVRLK